MKGDYLHHFSLPRLDLLAWVLIKKLAPTFYQKLDVMLIDIGRFRELPKWRKDFKADWKKAMETPITMPINNAWRPNAKRFVCTCPRFVVSRFLLCKHVVQLFHPVNPRFFLEVTRNRTLPFWSHHSLKPLIEDTDATEEDLDHPLATGGDGDDNAWSWLNMAGQNFEDESNDGRNDNEGEGDEGEGNEGKGDDGLWCASPSHHQFRTDYISIHVTGQFQKISQRGFGGQNHKSDGHDYIIKPNMRGHLAVHCKK